MSVRLFKLGAGNSCSVCVGFAQLDLYSVEILNSGNLDQSKFGRLHRSGFACKQQGVAAWYASGVDHGKEVLGCTRVVATYAAMVEGIAALQPLRRANFRGYRQVKILTDATEVVLGIRKADRRSLEVLWRMRTALLRVPWNLFVCLILNSNESYVSCSKENIKK